VWAHHQRLCLTATASQAAATVPWLIVVVILCSPIAVIALMEGYSRSGGCTTNVGLDIRRCLRVRLRMPPASHTSTQPPALPIAAEAVLTPHEPIPPGVLPDVVAFQLAETDTGKLIRTYTHEGPALGFIRDVVRLRGHEDAAQFQLRMVRSQTLPTVVAEGDRLVKQALEDRVL
jgi:hypothetical protein